MRRLTLSICMLLAVSLTVTQLSAQGRGAAGGGNAGRGAATAVTSTSSSASSSSPVSYSSYSGSSPNVAGPIGDRAFSSSPGYSSGYGAGSISTPSLQGTSFYTPNLYYSWNDYYGYLNRYYNVSPVYFTRFYKNVEPLMTPAMQRMTLRQPLFVSTEMLKMIDQLEMVYRDSVDGKAVNREDLIAKSQEIRKLAKQIRQNPTLTIMDIRKDEDLYKNSGGDALSLESIAKLREMALSLNQQLNDMIASSSSSTVSVESYKQPSFGSMTKGIEKVCKAIESSSKKL